MSSTLPSQKTSEPFASSPDDRLARAAERQLREGTHLPLLRLTCTCQDGVVAIHGRVPSYYLKQLAQTLVRRLHEVRGIDNRVQVVARDPQTA